MDTFLLYLFTRLDPLIFILVGSLMCLLVTIFIFAFTSVIDHFDYEEQSSKLYKSYALKLLPYLALNIFLLIAIPRKEDVLFIVGGKIGIQLKNSEKVEETTSKLYRLLQKKLDEELQD